MYFFIRGPYLRSTDRDGQMLKGRLNAARKYVVAVRTNGLNMNNLRIMGLGFIAALHAALQNVFRQSAF